MTVIVLERVSPSLRGELTRWLLEVRAGVFVGRVSGMVRERLWNLVRGRLKDGAAVLLAADDGEQGYSVEVLGERAYCVADFDGLQLIRRV